jgi:hypothetical protein
MGQTSQVSLLEFDRLLLPFLSLIKRLSRAHRMHILSVHIISKT